MNTAHRMNARDWAVLGLAMLVGVVLRSVAIGHEALWGDEALTLMLAKLPLFDLLFRPVDPTPGLYYALHGLLVPDHAGAALARLPACIAGVLTIPAGYWLGRVALNRRAGITVAALIAVSPPLVDYSQEARAYSLLVLLITISAAAIVAAFPLDRTSSGKQVRWPCIVLFALAAVLAAYTHLVGWLWLMPAWLVALVAIDQRGAASRLQLASGSFILAVLLVPEFHRLLGYALSADNEFTWLKQPAVAELGKILNIVLLPMPEPWTIWWLPLILATIITVARNVALVGWTYWTIRSDLARLREAVPRRWIAACAVGILLSIPVAAWLIGFVITPILMIRTALPAVPGFFVVLAAMAHLKGKGPATSVLVLGYAASTLATGLTRAKEPWFEVSAVVSKSEHKSLILFCPTWRAPAFLAAAEALHLGGSTVLAFKKGVARRVSIDFGRDPFWANRYVELAMKPALPAYRMDRAAGRLVQFPISSEIILIRSVCPDSERKAMMSWLGSGEVTKAGTASIGFEVFRPAQRSPRPVLIN